MATPVHIVIRGSVVLFSSTVLWLAPAGAKTTDDKKPAAAAKAKKAEGTQKQADQASEGAKRRKADQAKGTDRRALGAEADAIANLDNPRACSVFKDAAEEKTPGRQSSKPSAGRRHTQAAPAKPSPEVPDLFDREVRAAARPSYREIGHARKSGLSPQSVQRVIRSHRVEVATCFARASSGSTGEVVLELTIGSNGRVSSAAIAAKGASVRKLRRCVLPQAKRWRFPAAAAPTRVEFPFVFGSR